MVLLCSLLRLTAEARPIFAGNPIWMNSFEADAGRVVLEPVPILVWGQVGRGGDLGFLSVSQGMEVADWYRPVADIGLVLHLKKLNGLALLESKQLLGVTQDSVTSIAEFLQVSQLVLALV